MDKQREKKRGEDRDTLQERRRKEKTRKSKFWIWRHLYHKREKLDLVD